MMEDTVHCWFSSNLASSFGLMRSSGLTEKIELKPSLGFETETVMIVAQVLVMKVFFLGNLLYLSLLKNN